MYVDPPELVDSIEVDVVDGPSDELDPPEPPPELAPPPELDPPPELELPPELDELLELLDEELLEEVLVDSLVSLTVMYIVSLSVRLSSETMNVMLYIPAWVRLGNQEKDWLRKVAPDGRLFAE